MLNLYKKINRPFQAFTGQTFAWPFLEKLRLFRKAKDGVAAIEFALIAPIMFGVYVGVVEISIAVKQFNRTASTASVVGDLFSRAVEVDSDQIGDIMTAGLAVMGANRDDISNERLSIELLSYGVDVNDNVELLGTARFGRPLGDPYDVSAIPAPLLNVNSGIVIARIEYRYEPITTQYFGALDMKETFFIKPRSSPTITFSGDSSGATLTGCAADSRFIVSGC